MTWNASTWNSDFRRAGPKGRRKLRKRVFEDTVDAVTSRQYDVGGRTVDLDENGAFAALHNGTVMYTATDDLVVSESQRGRFETHVSVIEADCLEIGQLFASLGLEPVVLNMANRRNPGGGVLNGSGAQEENIFRRSNLLYSLYQFAPYGDEYGVPSHESQSYPIGRKSGAIYSPGVTVFRSSENTGYRFLEAPRQLAVVTVPAISNPPLVERNDRLMLEDAMIEPTKVKIRAILRVAVHHGHKAAVLSAFGCGAFCNPPHHVAKLFAGVLREPEFSGVFRCLCFAILDDQNSGQTHNPEGNLAAFLGSLEEQHVQV